MGPWRKPRTTDFKWHCSCNFPLSSVIKCYFHTTSKHRGLRAYIAFNTEKIPAFGALKIHQQKIADHNGNDMTCYAAI